MCIGDLEPFRIISGGPPPLLLPSNGGGVSQKKHSQTNMVRPTLTQNTSKMRLKSVKKNPKHLQSPKNDVYMFFFMSLKVIGVGKKKN